MQTSLRSLRKPLAAAVLLSSAAALVSQPALAGEPRWVVHGPAVVSPAPAPTPGYGRDHDRNGHDRFDGDRDDRDGARHGWRDWRRDERPPTIGDLTPLPGERVGERYRMTVSARFSDYAAGIDPASVRLRIDGRDVTGASRIGPDEVRFHNNLFPGRHLAEVVVRDRAGNTARRSWQFDVVDRGRDDYRDDYRDGYGDGYGYGAGRWGWQR